jgi:hypothetical protein
MASFTVLWTVGHAAAERRDVDTARTTFAEAHGLASAHDLIPPLALTNRYAAALLGLGDSAAGDEANQVLTRQQPDPDLMVEPALTRLILLMRAHARQHAFVATEAAFNQVNTLLHHAPLSLRGEAIAAWGEALILRGDVHAAVGLLREAAASLEEAGLAIPAARAWHRAATGYDMLGERGPACHARSAGDRCVNTLVQLAQTPVYEPPAAAGRGAGPARRL